MNFIRTMLFGQGANAEEQKQKDEYVESDLTRILSQEDLESVITTSLSSVQLGILKPKANNAGQIKETIFIESQLWLTTKEFQIEGLKSTVVVIQVSNEQFDESQNQEALKQLPLTKDLQVMSYTGFTDDGEDQVLGFVFIYQDYNLVYTIEQVLDGKNKAKEHDQRDAFEQLKNVICQVLFAINEGKNYKSVPKKQYLQYCQQTTLDFLLNQPSLIQTLHAEGATKAADISTQQKAVQKTVKKYEESKVQQIVKKMKSIDIMKEEIKQQDEFKVQVVQRLLQVKGDLYEYNPLEDANQLRVGDVFLCLDQVAQYSYLMNIVDNEGKVSYTRKEITNLSDFQLDQQSQGVCFIGSVRRNGYIPGYFFQLPSEKDFQSLKNTLTKCVFEAQNQQSYEKATEEGDNEYFEQQLVGDVANKDVDMKEIDDNVDEYDYFSFGQDQQKQIDESVGYERLLDLIDQDSVNYGTQQSSYDEKDRDEDEEEEKVSRSQGNNRAKGDVNSETLQAQSYDRTFILSGPVIKVYQNAEESGFGNVYDHQRLSHCVDLPQIQDQDGNKIIPSNLLLHNNESSLVFKNQQDPSQLFMFDLESGKVVQQIKTGKEFIDFKQLSNENKNGQRDPERTLLGIERKGIFQLDPRIGANSIVESKTYKTDPQFSSICPTLQGGFAIGSENGEIRLYKQVGQNAKTLLPGLGEPIKSIDVSLDKKWILATCKTYLLVIPTSISSGQNGFEKSMGKEKPNPMKLTLDPKDIIKNQIKVVNFTPARFNNGDTVSDTSIVTSTGDFLVTWNFEKVKRGILRTYKIKNLHENAVEGQFQFNNEEKVLVTLPQTITVETRKRQPRRK